MLWQVSKVILSFVFTGIWQRKDGTQQQLQPLWEVYPGELSWKRSRTRVSISLSFRTARTVDPCLRFVLSASAQLPHPTSAGVSLSRLQTSHIALRFLFHAERSRVNKLGEVRCLPLRLMLKDCCACREVEVCGALWEADFNITRFIRSAISVSER